ncbi:hypothetical protein BH09BAC1_BH09BAC1_29260 [soil metagenome]
MAGSLCFFNIKVPFMYLHLKVEAIDMYIV